MQQTQKHSYEIAEGYATCVDCGAQAKEGETVVHYPGCVPGDSERWREYYNEPEEEHDETIAKVTCNGPCEQLKPLVYMTVFPVDGKNYFYCPDCLE